MITIQYHIQTKEEPQTFMVHSTMTRDTLLVNCHMMTSAKMFRDIENAGVGASSQGHCRNRGSLVTSARNISGLSCKAH